jgi:hypothetical protein
MCGQERRVAYPSETACYRALDELYKRNPASSFKYVICQPLEQPEGAALSENEVSRG